MPSSFRYQQRNERGHVLNGKRRQAKAHNSKTAAGNPGGGTAALQARGLVVSHLGVAVDVEFADGTRRRARVARKSGIVVGDEVVIDGERALMLERRTALLRRSPGGGVHVVAANLDVLGVVAAVDPPARAGLVDRAAVAARSAGIEPFLVINKIDLEGAADIVVSTSARVAGDMQVFAVSAASGAGTDALAAFVAERGRGALVGPSGVGKSSLLNRLMPGMGLHVRTLSEAHGAGRHTTTVSTLHKLPGGGELVDTPGIREFGLVDVLKGDLARFFPGFHVVVEGCRFRDCLHCDEPGCAIKNAVTAGRVPEARYGAYLNLLAEL